jgi:homoserine kinase
MLPESVPFVDAAVNVSRAALLVHALTVDPSRLLTATEDRLHQRARAAAYPDSVALVDRLRDAGVPAVISGAGPSVLAFSLSGAEPVIAQATQDSTWVVRSVDVAGVGAREVPIPPID